MTVSLQSGGVNQGAGSQSSGSYNNHTVASFPVLEAGWMVIAAIGWYNAAGIRPPTPENWFHAGSKFGGDPAAPAEDTHKGGVSFYYAYADDLIALGGTAVTEVIFAHGDPADTNRALWGYTYAASKSLAFWTTPVCEFAVDPTPGDTFSATMSSDPGAAVGDLIFCAGGVVPNTSYTASASWPGATLTAGTLLSGGSTAGYNIRNNLRHFVPTAGPSTGAPTITTTQVVNGVIGVMRLRDTDTPPPVDLPVTLSSTTDTSPTFTAPLSLHGAELTFRVTDDATGEYDEVNVTVLPASERAVIGGTEVPAVFLAAETG